MKKALLLSVSLLSLAQISLAQTDAINIIPSGYVGISSTTPVSSLEVAGSYGQKVTTLAANITLDATHNTLVCNPAGGSFIVTLPAAAGATGRVYVIKRNATVTANTVTVAGGATLDGAASFILSLPNQAIVVFSDGTEWKSRAGGLSGNASAWALTGNAGTTAGTNYLGTTDAVDMVLKTAGTERARILSGGNFGVGDASPASLFTVGSGDLFQINSAGQVPTIQGYSPANLAIRMTPNFHLNSMAGNAVILNWDNGTTGATQTFRIGNGASADVFYVYADGQAFTTNWWRSLGNTGWYSQAYGGGIWMDQATYVRVYNGKGFTVPGNVGIGSDTPGYKLDITGDTRTTGKYTGHLNVDDTRAANTAPTGYNNEVAFDFKQFSVLNSAPGSGTYGGLITMAPWADNSGDASHQLLFNEGGIYWRQGQPDAAAWDAWSQVLTTGAGGAGTTNYHAKFTGANSIGNSLIYDNGTAVGIGTTAPLGKFHVAGTHANGVMVDGNDRPSMAATGNYPQMVLMAGVANASHGATVMLGGYDSGNSGNHKHWSIGTAGNGATFLDIGYHAGTDLNPHAGIRNYNGSTFMTILNNGNVGIGSLTPVAKLNVIGTQRQQGDMEIDAGSTLYFGREESFGGGDVGGADYGFIRWDNDNNSYNYWGDSGENGALVIGSQNDGANTASDVLVLNGMMNVFNPNSGINYFTGNVGIGSTSPAYRLDAGGGSFGFGSANQRTETRDNAGLQGNAGAQSGFYETSAPSNYYSGASSWQHMIDVRHSNTGNNYAMQLAGSFFDQDMYMRKTDNSATTAWRRVVTSRDVVYSQNRNTFGLNNANSGWRTVGDATTAMTVKTGDVIAISHTSKFRWTGGSGGDHPFYGIYISGCATTSVTDAERIGTADDLPRGQWQSIAGNYVWVATCSGTVQFTLYVDNNSDADDNSEHRDIVIIAQRY